MNSFTSILLVSFFFLQAFTIKAQSPPSTNPNEQYLDLLSQTGGLAFSVARYGQYALLGAGPRMLVIDVSDPAQPVQVGQTGLFEGTLRTISVIGHYAYLFPDMSNYWHIVDLTDPTLPQYVGAITNGLAIPKTTLVGDLLYCINWPGLVVMNVSNATAPVEIARYEIPGINGFSATSVSASGNTLYAADRYGELRMLDISNPSQPTETAGYSRLYSPQDLFAIGYLVYVADEVMGLFILQGSELPALPIERQIEETQGGIS